MEIMGWLVIIDNNNWWNDEYGMLEMYRIIACQDTIVR